MPSSSVSGLSRLEAKKARRLTINAALLGYHHASALHYTQSSARWQGIDHHLKAWKGQYPTEADCSSFATWCLWNGLDHYHLTDIVNGQNWRAGYTGTLLEHGRRVDIKHARAGDLVFYGSGWPGHHVAIYHKDGMVISHGSEGGPYYLSWNYRGDYMQTRRYI